MGMDTGAARVKARGSSSNINNNDRNKHVAANSADPLAHGYSLNDVALVDDCVHQYYQKEQGLISINEEIAELSSDEAGSSAPAQRRDRLERSLEETRAALSSLRRECFSRGYNVDDETLRQRLRSNGPRDRTHGELPRWLADIPMQQPTMLAQAPSSCDTPSASAFSSIPQTFQSSMAYYPRPAAWSPPPQTSPQATAVYPAGPYHRGPFPMTPVASTAWHSSVASPQTIASSIPFGTYDPLNQFGHIDRGIISIPQMLARTDPETAALEPTFEKRGKPKKFFKIGKVFMALWSEPSNDDDATTASVETFRGKYGEQVYSKIRRFVVVRECGNHCLAVPILTYRGFGVSNRGIVKSDHGIIYSGKKVPQPTAQELPSRGEAGMSAVPIRVVPDDPTDKIHPMSRINYSKIYTIEHYFKVRSIGMVALESMAFLAYQPRSQPTNKSKKSKPEPAATGQTKVDGEQPKTKDGDITITHIVGKDTNLADTTSIGMVVENVSTSTPRSFAGQRLGANKQHEPAPWNFFHVGKVFESSPTELMDRMITAADRAGATAATESRRFIVISQQKRHCIALSIVTRESKDGFSHQISDDDCGLVYSTRKSGQGPPAAVKGSLVAVRVEPIDGANDLPEESYIDYTKMHSIEYNEQVVGLGVASGESLDIFVRQAAVVRERLFA